MTVDVSSGHSGPPISLGCAVTTTTSDPASWKFKGLSAKPAACRWRSVRIKSSRLWQSQSPGSHQRHSTSGAKIASSASKSPRRQASNPCATVRLELLLITPPRWRLPRKISVPGERRSWLDRSGSSPAAGKCCPLGVVDAVAAGREQAGRSALPACVSQAGPVRPKSGPAVVVEKDLGDAGGLFQGGEVSGVAKRDRSGATRHGDVGFTLWLARPVVIAVDQSDRGGDATVERSGGDHAVDIAEDFPRHARIPAATANPAQFREVVLRQLAAVEQTAPQHDAQDRLVLHPRDRWADCREASTADVDRGDAIGSTDAFGVVVRVEGDDASHAVFKLGRGRKRHRRAH